MFTKKEIKQNLLGCFEICLFMRKGVERFEASKTSALKSFIIVLLLFPISIITIMAIKNESNLNLLVVSEAGHMIGAMIIFLGFVYYFMKQYNKEEHFWRFITITNWMSIPSMIMLAPIFIGLGAGVEMQHFASFAIFMTLLGYIYKAFVLAHCFKIPWELGGFIAIVSLAINQNLSEVGVFLHTNLLSIS